MVGMVDVIAAAGELDDSTKDVFRFIEQHQATEREMISGWWQSWFVEARARVEFVESRIATVMNNLPYGGTTADYENALSKIASALSPYDDELAPYKAKIRKEYHLDPK